MHWFRTLTAKALIVIALPLLIQLAFLAAHANLTAKIQELSEADFHARSVIGRCNWISALLLTATIVSVVGPQRDERLAQAWQFAKRHMPIDIAALQNDVKDNPDQSRCVKEMVPICSSLMDSLRKKTAIYECDRSELGREIDEWVQLRRLRSELLSRENLRGSVNFDSLPQIRRNQNNLMVVGEIFSIAAAVVMLSLFVKNVSSRLRVMTENTQRFVKREPLHEPISGADEVALLDRKFHEMTDLILEHEKRKQEFLLMLSHDLRSPLTAALSAVELVATGVVTGEEKTAHVLQRAQRGLSSSLLLIDDLLDIERLESGSMPMTFETCGIEELVTGAADNVKMLAERKNIEIVYQFSVETIFADRKRIAQVIINLLANAIKFSPNGSKIVIAANKNDDGTELTVSDQGRGIEANKIAGVFDRFSQTRADDARIGSGLGLAICKALVCAHGGRIGVRSSEGVGTTFWFSVPNA